MARKIIGLSGFIGSGKDTVADILVAEHGFKRISFADRLKDTVSTIFGWDRSWLEGNTPDSRIWREQTDEFWSSEFGFPATPRAMLQRVGTDSLRRGLHEQIWISVVKKEFIENPEINYVVSDVRFFNERKLIRDFQGQSWRIRRGSDPDWINKAISDNRYGTDWMTEYPDIHESEWRWIDYDVEFDHIIHNNTTNDDLALQVLRYV